MSLALAGVVPPLYERNQEATIYIGNLDQKVTDDIVWELFIQCGPVVNVHIPKDKISGEHQGYGFVEFKSEEDADYAIKIMHMIKLYGKPIKVNKASQDKRTQEVGANLFIGNLDTEIDEKTLYETFSAFGHILSTKIMRNPETGVSKGYGFVSYDIVQAIQLNYLQVHIQQCFLESKYIEYQKIIKMCQLSLFTILIVSFYFVEFYYYSFNLKFNYLFQDNYANQLKIMISKIIISQIKFKSVRVIQISNKYLLLYSQSNYTMRMLKLIKLLATLAEIDLVISIIQWYLV